MKVLIVGADGQLGRALQAGAPTDATITACNRAQLDITDTDAVASVMARTQPDILFNAAAYTSVDRAEAEPVTADAVNAVAVGGLADAARAVGAHFVHLSTDFVFDGLSGKPYAPDAETAPLNAYGRSKRAGERLAGDDALVVRTSWLYAATGGNFVLTMLRLMRERSPVRVVADQIGAPTYAPGLAKALWRLGRDGVRGMCHYSDCGVASRYDFAMAIQEEAMAIGLIETAVPVIPVATADFPLRAARPPCVILDKAKTWALLGNPAPHWRAQLRTMLAEVKADG